MGVYEEGVTLSLEDMKAIMSAYEQGKQIVVFDSDEGVYLDVKRITERLVPSMNDGDEDVPSLVIETV